MSRSPLPADPSSRSLDYGNERRVDRGPRVRGAGPRPRAPLGFLCALALPIAVSEPVPLPNPGRARERSPVTSAALILLPFAVRIAAKPGSARAKKWKGERLSASHRQLAKSPSPVQTLAIPTATFSLPSGFPLACGERAPGR
ncbi:unnamed protein product [Rangifer tarandus platyrhynchus]|uniref:Uncharacterized protein n=1 Tax=Rangifer tarandus platyrhynchus TaxID=3082113 RepID=A0ABN8YAZ3_RANTA|nr:unnamed protein product [Rangifer tarandus platyrhynchus]